MSSDQIFLGKMFELIIRTSNSETYMDNITNYLIQNKGVHNIQDWVIASTKNASNKPIVAIVIKPIGIDPSWRYEFLCPTTTPQDDYDRAMKIFG